MTGFTDDFNRANGALVGSTPTPGGGPVYTGGANLTVNGNRAVGAGGSTWVPTVADAATNVVDVTVTVPVVGSGGIVLRYADVNNWLLIQVQATGLGAYRRVAGTFTQIGSLYTGTVSAGAVLRAVIDASHTLSVYLNGVLRIGPVVETAGSANTKHGLVPYANPSFDDLVLVDLAAGGGAVDLTLAGLASATTTGAVALTQAHQLTPAGLACATTTGAVAVTQVHQLAVAGMAVATTTGTVALPAPGAINLAAAGMASAATTGAVAVTQAHQLTPAGLACATTSGAVAVTQVHQLAAAGMAVATTTGTVALPAPGSINLAAAGLASATTTGAVALIQVHHLAAAGMAVATGTGTVAVVQVPEGGINLQPSTRRQVVYPQRRRSVDCCPL